jgi:hypothetical protein
MEYLVAGGIIAVIVGVTVAGTRRRAANRRRQAPVTAVRPAAPAPAPAPSPTPAVADRLTELAALRAAGSLTEEEFTQAKAKLLGD